MTRCLVSHAARLFANEPALIDPIRTLTFADYDKLVGDIAANLVHAGIKRSDRVGLCLPNSIDYVATIFALIRIGAVACPISTRLPKAGVDSCLRKAGALCLIADSSSDALPDVPVLSVRELDRHSQQAQIVSDEVTLDQPATVLFTSGSTGEPKAALLNIGNHYFNALGSNANISFGPGERWLLSLPLYHVGGLGILFRSLLSGGSVVIDAERGDLLPLIVNHSVTHLSLVSTQLQRLLSSEVPPNTARNLKAVLLGGGPIPFSLISSAHERSLPIHTSYGLTEMGSQVTTAPPRASQSELLTSGRLLPHRELTFGPNDEILVRGATRFCGYVDGLRLEEPFDSEGWFATGDSGRLDADGNLCVTGRLDTMFISGGENIHPEEIENALCRLDIIQQAMVVPVPSREYGARPVAFVQMAREHSVDGDDIRERMRDILPGYKLPDKIFGWPTQLVSPGLKPDRAEFARLARSLIGSGY